MQAPMYKNHLRRVTVLGSSGSIGKSTIDLLQRYTDSFVVEALTANHNIDLLAEQAILTRAKLAVTADPKLYKDLKNMLGGTETRVAAGPEALEEAASLKSEFVMAGIVGAAGLGPTLAAIKRGAVVGLANKECLVCAGNLMLEEAKRSGATILPVDSEHNAIFQVFDFKRDKTVKRIVLTASGGPFREMGLDQMALATPKEAIAHPNWNMGSKISVDSATMMNKGLEIIEAFYLFPVNNSQIDVLIHPQSIIHSMVEYVDGSMLAQLGSPDMRTPIAYALAWPERIATPTPELDLAKIGSLTFENPDIERFPCLRLAKDALERSAESAIVLNAANEIAVQSFLNNKITFVDIPRVVESCLDRLVFEPATNIKAIKEIDSDVRLRALEMVDGL